MERKEKVDTGAKEGGGARGRVGGDEEDKKGEERRRAGRPTTAESMVRERASSMSNIEKFLRGEKRKDRQGEDKVAEEAEKGRKSTRIGKSPEGEKKGGWAEVAMEMRNGIREIMREIKELKESREEMRVWREEMKEGWERERAGLMRRVEGLERRLEEQERKGKEKEGGVEKVRVGEKGQGEERERRGESKEWEERLRKLEWEGERLRREERKRNIIIKGVRVKREGTEGLREEVEQIIRATGAAPKIEGMRRIGKKDKEGREMIWVRLADVREKLDVMRGKAKLRDRREWVVDDLTEKERKIEWWLKREADRYRREGKRVRVGYMKLWIEGRLWKWDERKEELKEEGREEEGREGNGGESKNGGWKEKGGRGSRGGS